MRRPQPGLPATIDDDSLSERRILWGLVLLVFATLIFAIVMCSILAANRGRLFPQLPSSNRNPEAQDCNHCKVWTGPPTSSGQEKPPISMGGLLLGPDLCAACRELELQ